MGGAVFSGEYKLAKPSDMLAEDAPIEERRKDHTVLCHGVIQLVHGLTHFDFDVTGMIGLDVGSSTGAFTDVLLSRGAAKVYAVVVGTNQLAWKLRQDSRVVVQEQTNARFLTAEQVPEPIDIVVCDASFISLEKVLEAPLKLAKSGSRLVALVKPQFEAGREEVGKGGVVRDPSVHERVCTQAKVWVEEQGWTVLGVVQSPITGPEGNIEFLLGAEKNG